MTKENKIDLESQTIRDANLNLWNMVASTNPENTKKVKKGDKAREFTAIDAYSQIREATRQFGPMGMGWGYDVEHSYVDNGKAIAATLKLWYKEGEEKSEPITTVDCAKLYNKYEQYDDDAYKKATTGAMTKALSYLGFNADVFLGKFDDNKYIEDQKKKYAEQTEKEIDTLVGEIKVAFKKSKTLEEFETIKAEQEANVEKVKAASEMFYNSLVTALIEHKKGLIPKAA